MPIKTIRYLATLLALLTRLCKYLPLAAQTVRKHVPSENLEAYDAGSAAVFAFCELLQTINYTGDGVDD